MHEAVSKKQKDSQPRKKAKGLGTQSFVAPSPPTCACDKAAHPVASSHDHPRPNSYRRKKFSSMFTDFPTELICASVNRRVYSRKIYHPAQEIWLGVS